MHQRVEQLLYSCCKDPLDALAAYYWNVQLSESLYATLQALEIALRNALHRSLTQDYQTENWFGCSFLIQTFLPKLDKYIVGKEHVTYLLK